MSPPPASPSPIWTSRPHGGPWHCGPGALGPGHTARRCVRRRGPSSGPRRCCTAAAFSARQLSWRQKRFESILHQPAGYMGKPVASSAEVPRATSRERCCSTPGGIAGVAEGKRIANAPGCSLTLVTVASAQPWRCVGLKKPESGVGSRPTKRRMGGT